ncbi:10360_t:CDS:2, partial [Acaulospora colombiana]
LLPGGKLSNGVDFPDIRPWSTTRRCCSKLASDPNASEAFSSPFISSSSTGVFVISDGRRCPNRQEASDRLRSSLWGLALRWHRDLLQCPLVTLCLLSVTLHDAQPLMASSQTPDTHVSPTIGLHPHQPQHPPIDKEAALRQLAAQAKISQTQNKLSNVPFSALEKRLDEESLTPKQSPSVLLLDPLSFDKSITDTQRMPPPPAPSQTLFSSILDTTTDIETRPAKRQKLGPSGTARAMAPSANGFSIPHIISTDANDHHESKRKPHSNSNSHTKASASSHSPKKKASSKKAPRTSLPMADKEQLAAKTLASLLVAKGSPKSPVKSRSDRSSIHEDDTSSVAGDDRRTKSLRRAPSSVSSVDAAMADASLSVNGDASTTDGNGSGMDTVPGSPALSATQRERDSAELLLLLATSPSPARNTTRRAPLPTNRAGSHGPVPTIEPRVLFQESSSSISASNSGSTKSSKGLNEPFFPTSVTSNITPSSLLPAPPSPSKKSSSTSKTSEDRFMVPQTLAALGIYPSGNGNSGTPSTSMLQPPFTPGESLHGNPSTNFGSATAGFGTGFALGLGALGPSTPTAGLSFNMADYINFTPTPGGGFSPVQKPATSKTGNSGSGLLAAPVSIGVQNIFASGGPSSSLEFGTAAGALSPKKSDSPEKKRSKKTSLSSNADKKSEASTLAAVAAKTERLGDSNIDGELSASLKGTTKQTNNGDPTSTEAS